LKLKIVTQEYILSTLMDKKSKIIGLGFLVLVIIAAAAVVFYARGFKLDSTGNLTRTGLLVIDSTPDGAQVFLDERLTSAADTTITFLTPKTYHLKLTKEGYTTWEKDVEIKADLTTEVNAVLFPSIPELKPLTFTGVESPVLSNNGEKLVYGVSSGEKAGLWVIGMEERALSFNRAPTPQQLVKDTSSLKFSNGLASWSPDDKTILVTLQENEKDGEQFTRNYLLEEGKLNTSLRDSTGSLPATLASWQQEVNLKEDAKVKRLPKELAGIASKSATLILKNEASISGKLNPYPANLIWSPDEFKFFVEEKDKITIHKFKDPNPLIKTPDQFELPKAQKVFWYPDSEHLVLVEKDKIDIVEVEGTNRVTIYSGSFENSNVYVWPNGSKLVILTTFNQGSGSLPNLYAINLQ